MASPSCHAPPAAGNAPKLREPAAQEQQQQGNSSSSSNAATLNNRANSSSKRVTFMAAPVGVRLQGHKGPRLHNQRGSNKTDEEHVRK